MAGIGHVEHPLMRAWTLMARFGPRRLVAGVFVLVAAPILLGISARAPRFVVSPYLQWPSRAAMTIRCETSHPGTMTVQYGTDERRLLRSRATTKSSVHHEVRLTGLEADTRYTYRVIVRTDGGRQIASKALTFQTAAARGDAFTFAVVGDTQDQPVCWRPVARRLFEERPNFVLHVGDLVGLGSDKAQWHDDFFEPAEDLFAHIPFVSAIGNHEEDASLYYTYIAAPPPERWYTLSYGDADFFVLDTNVATHEGSRQYAWLDQALSRSDARWKIVAHHHPTWCSDSNDYGDAWCGTAACGDERARPLVPLFEKHGVALVFFGHVHTYERSRPLWQGRVDVPRGITYVLTGGGGGRLEQPGPTRTWHSARVRRTHHFCLVDVYPDHLELRAIDSEGRLFDQARIHDARTARATRSEATAASPTVPRHLR